MCPKAVAITARADGDELLPRSDGPRNRALLGVSDRTVADVRVLAPGVAQACDRVLGRRLCQPNLNWNQGSEPNAYLELQHHQCEFDCRCGGTIVRPRLPEAALHSPHAGS